MIRSMTGYGRGECTLYDRKFTVEIKSVNHRYLELSVKLPRVMNPLEDRLRQRLTGNIGRGKVDVYVNYESFSADDALVRLNTVLCDAYVKAYGEIRARYGISEELSLSLLSRIPDALALERNAESETTLAQMWETVSRALDGAIQSFTAMKEREGAALKADLLAKAEGINVLVAGIAGRAPGVAQEYAERLRRKVEEALGALALDEARLLQEITIFADKSCIDEELTRLSSHLSQFSSILESGTQAGKKLDFLIQEINREINTIGSKSNDLEITKAVVELKSELEKVREQVQNIE